MNEKQIQKQVKIATWIAQDLGRNYSELTADRFVRNGVYGLMSQYEYARQMERKVNSY